MTIRITRRRAVYGAAAVTVLAAVGLAVAAWFVIANGTGHARAGSIAAPTVSPGTAPPDLFPNANPTGTAAFVINNPNPSPLAVTAISPNGGVTGSGTCSGDLVTLVPQTGLNVPVPAGTSEVEIPNVVRLDPSAPTTCQNAEFNIPASLTFSPPAP